MKTFVGFSGALRLSSCCKEFEENSAAGRAQVREHITSFQGESA
jgi:hypothetical protein